MRPKWKGELPVMCGICRVDLGKLFTHGETTLGREATMCLDCHSKVGCGFGPNTALFQKDGDGAIRIAGGRHERERLAHGRW